MAKKMTENQRLYNQQVKRIRNIVNKYSKNYYVEFELPETPQRITKSDIARLKAITPTTIRQTSYTNYFDPETGEYRTAQDLFKLRHEMLSVRMSDAVLNEVERVLRIFNVPGFDGYDIIYSKYRQLLSMYERPVVAAAFQFANENYDLLGRAVLYKSGPAIEYANTLTMFFDQFVGISDDELDAIFAGESL